MNRDFSDLLSAFTAHGVEYLVVGAHALAAHGRIRATKDLDVWVRPDSSNAAAVMAALRAFGSPLHDLTDADLREPGTVFQIGVPPVRIDIVTAIDGVEFPEAWASRVKSRFAGIDVWVLSRELLVKNKRALGRKQDLADVEWLERHPGGKNDLG